MRTGEDAERAEADFAARAGLPPQQPPGPSSRRRRVLAGVVSGVVSGLFAIVAVAGFFEAAALRDRGVEVQAEVTGVDRAGRSWGYEVRFTTPDGTTNDEDALDGPGSTIEVGDRVLVTYDPQDPSTVARDIGDVSWDARLSAVMSVFFLGIGVGNEVLQRRRARSS